MSLQTKNIALFVTLISSTYHFVFFSLQSKEILELHIQNNTATSSKAKLNLRVDDVALYRGNPKFLVRVLFQRRKLSVMLIYGVVLLPGDTFLRRR